MISRVKMCGVMNQMALNSVHRHMRQTDDDSDSSGLPDLIDCDNDSDDSSVPELCHRDGVHSQPDDTCYREASLINRPCARLQRLAPAFTMSPLLHHC